MIMVQKSYWLVIDWILKSCNQELSSWKYTSAVSFVISNKIEQEAFFREKIFDFENPLQLIIVPPSGLSIGPWQVLKTDPAIIVSNYHPALEISIDQHFIELRKARRMLCNCTVYLKSCDEISPYLYRGLSNSCESEGLLEATRRQLSHLLRQQHLHNFKVISAMSLIIIYYRFFTSLLF